jgi:hypothetical protein
MKSALRLTALNERLYRFKIKKNTLACLFYLYNFTINSSVKILISRCEYMNAKHRKDGGYMKMDIYLGIRLVGEEIFLG